jgi:hypothetical protein
VARPGPELGGQQGSPVKRGAPDQPYSLGLVEGGEERKMVATGRTFRSYRSACWDDSSLTPKLAARGGIIENMSSPVFSFLSFSLSLYLYFFIT